MATRKANKQQARPLDAYRAKRDFARTPEPSGDTSPDGPPGAGLRFCVQKHLATHLHYDFRLEHQGVLLSWAVPKGPSLRPADRRLAMMTEDHPLDYLAFEGVIPEGYGAGVVLLWDLGTWALEDPSRDAAEALRRGELKFTLNGYKLKGRWVLTHSSGSGDRADERRWLLIKRRDQWAGDLDIAAFAPASVKTRRDLQDIAADEESPQWLSHRVSQSRGRTR